jgi:hypothetical protein
LLELEGGGRLYLSVLGGNEIVVLFWDGGEEGQFEEVLQVWFE